ncbi:hypothetical protein AC480_05410 [miscellaneous Crenarchaeota group archaeon SMTZ1-55]|nr:MAG: hypothetical protein AC480_05410 [miscellaneous Crenarchaeota group archaeon SMTZ1-55]
MKKKTEGRSMEVQVEKERTEFKTLMIQNPNYFGNLPKSPFKTVKKIVGNTTYEELTCIGFNPNLNMLEATVHVKLPIGYGGNLCKAGTTEYVRFFIDYGDGWEDAGLVAFNVHDVPNANDCAGKPNKPLAYVVTLPIEPTQDYCGNPVLPKVRAILSWEATPPDDDPDWPMVWGNTLERRIQIKPRLWLLADVVKVLGVILKQEVKLPPIFEEVEPCPIPQPEPPPLTVPELVQLYAAPAGAKTRREKIAVEPHRFGFNEIQAQLTMGAVNPQMVAEMIAQWDAVGLDWSAAVEALQATSGNVSYEEVKCLGLDNNREWLVATFHVKKPCGYSGNLCTKGSKEYVAFWADWDDTCEWTYLDTVEVPVHDIASIPADGLHYTAILPVNLHPHRQPCNKPKTARVRAVLSWNTPPSTTDPNAVPYWGNRLDAHVQIKPGTPWEPKARISILGGIGIADIQTAGNGMTKPQAKFAEWGTYADPWGTHMRECPFGGLVTVHAPPNVGDKYGIEVRAFGSVGPPTKITTQIWVVDKDGHGSYHTADPVTGLFDYLDVTQNVLNKLAQWSTSGDGLWEIRLRRYNGAGVWLDDTPWYRIRLDNTAPTAQITIDGGACDTYAPGAKITGKFVARDLHFGHFTLDTLPASMSPPSPTTGTPPVSSGNSQTAVAGNTWELNTATMKPCGYVVRVRVWDRTIRHSALGHHNYNVDDKGFCLLEEV